MYSQRASRAIISCAATMKSSIRQQVRLKSHSSTTHTNARSLSLAANAWQQQVALREQPMPDHVVAWATAGQASLRVEFGDGSVNEMPYSSLRNSCQCSKCTSLFRMTYFDEDVDINEHVDMEVYPEIIQRSEFGVVVDWSDGHISKYSYDWLRSASIIPPNDSINTYAQAT